MLRKKKVSRVKSLAAEEQQNLFGQDKISEVARKLCFLQK